MNNLAYNITILVGLDDQSIIAIGHSSVVSANPNDIFTFVNTN